MLSVSAAGVVADRQQCMLAFCESVPFWIPSSALNSRLKRPSINLKPRTLNPIPELYLQAALILQTSTRNPNPRQPSPETIDSPGVKLQVPALGFQSLGFMVYDFRV